MVLGTEADAQMELETRVCGIKEPFVFWLWSLAAGSPDASRLAGLVGVDDLSFTTQDNRVIRGYRLGSRVTHPRGYLLVLQGNAVTCNR